jgi:hypothetical protein
MSLMLVIISKLLESGIRYFGDSDLSKKWRYIAVVIFYGFSIPYYIYVSMDLCGFIKPNIFEYRPLVLVLFSPVILTILYLFIYYIHTLIISANFLNKIQIKYRQNNK